MRLRTFFISLKNQPPSGFSDLAACVFLGFWPGPLLDLDVGVDGLKLLLPFYFSVSVIWPSRLLLKGFFFYFFELILPAMMIGMGYGFGNLNQGSILFYVQPLILFILKKILCIYIKNNILKLGVKLTKKKSYKWL